MSKNILGRFRPQVGQWFEDVFAAPTPVQEQAWDKISQGAHALVVAPTGSGKTLAAFLWALNSLVEKEGQTALPVGPAVRGGAQGVKVLYISPLKALGVDVENNLRAPLNGIARTAERLGLDVPDITVGVRSGDTPSAERARQIRKPRTSSSPRRNRPTSCSPPRRRASWPAWIRSSSTRSMRLPEPSAASTWR